MNGYRILLADDHRMICAGLRICWSLIMTS